MCLVRRFTGFVIAVLDIFVERDPHVVLEEPASPIGGLEQASLVIVYSDAIGIHFSGPEGLPVLQPITLKEIRFKGVAGPTAASVERSPTARM